MQGSSASAWSIAVASHWPLCLLWPPSEPQPQLQSPHLKIFRGSPLLQQKVQAPSLVPKKPMIQPQILFQNNFLLSPYLSTSDQTLLFCPIPCLTDFLSLQDPNLLPLIREFYLNPQCFILGKLFAQLSPTLCDPTDCSPPGSSVHGISQPRTMEWVAIPFSRASSWRDQTCISCLGRQILYHWATREAPFMNRKTQNNKDVYFLQTNTQV